MSLFEKDRNIVVEDLAFHYEGRTYTGKGFLDWSIGSGFHLKALIERQGSPRSVVIPEDLQVLTLDKMPIVRLKKISNAKWAAFRMPISSPFEVSFKQLNHYPDSILFAHSRSGNDSKRFRGSARFSIANEPLLPDKLITETKLGGELITQESRRGLKRSELGFELRIVSNAENTLECFWEYWEVANARNLAWRYSDALQLALGLLVGESLPLLTRETYRNKRRYEQVCRPSKSTSFRHVWPLAQNHFDVSLLLHLAQTFSSDSKVSRICQSVFWILIDVSTQRSWSARCLLVSTILEGILRTDQAKPYVAGSHFDTKKSLQEFREKNLDDQWIDTCNLVHKTWQRLRHKYAHPDWIPVLDDPYSSTEMTGDLRDIRQLTLFYGIMILALTKSKVASPKTFPEFEPHTEQAP